MNIVQRKENENVEEMESAKVETLQMKANLANQNVVQRKDEEQFLNKQNHDNLNQNSTQKNNNISILDQIGEQTPEGITEFVNSEKKNLIITATKLNALNGFKNIVNKGLEGQFEVTLTQIGKSNSYIVGIAPVAGKGNRSKLTQKADNFLFFIERAMGDKKKTDLNLVYKDENVDVGKFGTDPENDLDKNGHVQKDEKRQVKKKMINDGLLDIYDMEQFYEHNSGLGGATQQGKLTHELTEQYYKQTENKGYHGGKNGAHAKAKLDENKVNGNERLDQEGKGLDYFQTFKEPDGTITTLPITKGKNYSVKKKLTAEQKEQKRKQILTEAKEKTEKMKEEISKTKTDKAVPSHNTEKLELLKKQKSTKKP